MSKQTERKGADASQNKKQDHRSAILLAVILVVVTSLVFGLYRSLLNVPYFEWVLIGYMVLATGFLCAYAIYNRGFFYRAVTIDRLPEEWSDEKKKEFVEEGAARRRRSRWLIIPIFAFLFTFAIDVIELFVLPFFSSLLFG